jgi:hypothetical protein
MAEALLNYSKTLEVLFGDTRDQQRAGLRAIGVPDDDIETRFIPVTLLRDFLDVAHPKLSQLDSQRLRDLYLFLIGLEHDFQTLLATARAAMATDVWEPAHVDTGPLGATNLKTLDRILASDARRRWAEEEKPDA